MAATAVTSVAHQLPPISMSIPPMPRIRPPRLLKGDPHPNNALPPSTATHPIGPKWVQGRYRGRRSSALRQAKEIQDIQVTKAIRHQTLGLDIYAYRHIRTNQVVYSLTRKLQNNKVLKQLVFHGKKTVPAVIRPDVWTPYFSIHFPATPAGALEGLFAFQKLRELSLQRQLSPPDSLIQASQQDVEIIKSKIGSPTTLQEMAVRKLLDGKIPKVGELLPKKLRAQKLMDHKATSVADAAFVLDQISSGPSQWEKLMKVTEKRLARDKDLSVRNKNRMSKMQQIEAKKEAQIQERIAIALGSSNGDSPTSFSVTQAAVAELSLEHQAEIQHGRLHSTTRAEEVKAKTEEWEAAQKDEQDRARQAAQEAKRAAEALERYENRSRRIEWLKERGTWNPAELPALEKPTAAKSAPIPEGPEKPEWSESRDIKMYWADINDGLFAESWPRNVIHGPLAPFSLAKRGTGSIANVTVHTIGSGLNDGWMPAEMVDGPYGKARAWIEPPETEEEVESEDPASLASPLESAMDKEMSDPFMAEPKPKSLWERLTGVFGR